MYGRTAKGFMGKAWDGGDLAFRPEFWSLYYDLLYPGAFGMAFASSRGWHRLAVAIEDAGFIIHPSIFGWGYGSGFPKATRIDSQLDKRAGVERPVIGEASRGKGRVVFGKYGSDETGTHPVEAAVTDEAKAWEGHRYGLQALKPSLEPIVVFQRPYKGSPLDSIVSTGAGALNIDGARIGDRGDEPQRQGKIERTYIYGDSLEKDRSGVYEDGRWPANLVTIGVDQPSDFFYNADWSHEIQERLDNADPVKYEAKADPRERERGLAKRDLKTLEELSGGGGFAHEYQTAYQARKTPRRNTHPTVKPIALIEHLATLLLPPEQYAPNRRILVPFAGSGSEMIGCMFAGWDMVLGIEKEREYIDIAKLRLAYYAAKIEYYNGLPTLPGVDKQRVKYDQMKLWDGF